MKKIPLLAGLAATLCGVAVAQPAPRIELSGGYSYTRAYLGPEIGTASLSGWDAAVTYNPLSIVGAVARVSAGYGRPVRDGFAVKTTFNSYLFGAQVRPHRFGRFIPFVYALVGWCAVQGRTEGFEDAAQSDRRGAWAAGGGLDIRAGKRFAVRAVQAEYFQTRSRLLLTDKQDHFRLSAGVVFYLWRRE